MFHFKFQFLSWTQLNLITKLNKTDSNMQITIKCSLTDLFSFNFSKLHNIEKIFNVAQHSIQISYI